MRKIILLLTLLFAGVIGEAYAQGIRFHEGSFDEALVRAKQEKKLIFIDFYTEWCGPCKWMSMNVFNRSEIFSIRTSCVVKLMQKKKEKNWR